MDLKDVCAVSFIALSRQTACAILNVAVTLCSRALDAEQTWHAVLSKLAACFPIYADVRNSKLFKGPISRVSQPTFTVRVMTTIRFLLLAPQCKHSVARSFSCSLVFTAFPTVAAVV